MDTATLGLASLDTALWYLVRPSGWVALVLGVLALFLGFIFSVRDTIGAKPAWWLDLHNSSPAGQLVLLGCAALFSYPLAVRMLKLGKKRPVRPNPSKSVGGSPRKEAYATR